MKKCCFIIPYFGKLPNYFPLFLKSCQYNEDFNWLIFTDDKSFFCYPPNVKVVPMTFSELTALISSKFDFTISLERPYKLCDYKPAYGYIFENYIKDYYFWGHCDIDTIMGNLKHFLTDEIFNMYDKIFCLGHMTLYKNTFENNRLFMSKYNGVYLYKNVLSSPEIHWFDEAWKYVNINDIFKEHKKRIYKKDLSMGIAIMRTYFQRSEYRGIDEYPFNNGHQIEEFIDALYIWNKGELFRLRLWGDKIYRQDFIYLHFQERPLHFTNKTLSCDKWKILTNKVVPLDLDIENITIKEFKKIKKKCFSTHYIKKIGKYYKNRIVEIGR